MSSNSGLGRRSLSRLAVLVAAAVLALPLGGPAEARSDDDRRLERVGDCSRRADWKLKAKADDGRIEVEGEVDSNRVGQKWRWKIKHNGSVSARGRAWTRGPSGSFSVERRIVDLYGVDLVVFRAIRRSTGEVCRGVVRF